MYGKSLGSKLFDAVNVVFMLLIVVVMVYPLLHVLSLSLSSTSEIDLGRVSFFPRGWNLEGYKFVIANSQFWNAYLHTILYVAIGTPISLFVTSLIAYPLAIKGFIFHKPLMIYLAITMFFSGGLIPTYLVVKSLGLINTVWAVTLPGVISAFNVIVYRTFFQSIPVELRESAFMDGANDLVILFRIYLPLSKPLLATFGLFSIVGIWNDWFGPMIYLNNINMDPVATYLQQILVQGNVSGLGAGNAAATAISNLLVSPVTIQMAVVVVAMIPVLVLYPFAQKYFTKGMLIGAIKG